MLDRYGHVVTCEFNSNDNNDLNNLRDDPRPFRRSLCRQVGVLSRVEVYETLLKPSSNLFVLLPKQTRCHR